MVVVVLKLDYHDEKCKEEVTRTVLGHSGVVSLALDTKDKKLTVKGDIDPGSLENKLRNLCPTKIVSVGAPKAPKMKDGKKKGEKEEAKKKELKKDKNLPVTPRCDTRSVHP